MSTIAYRLLYQHAEKGELYSMQLRSNLLAAKKIEHRVDIRALAGRAAEVFGKDKVMACALTREMVHDILVTKSDFDENGFAGQEMCSKNVHVTLKSAYFDMFYVRGGISSRNNVDWVSGVPFPGLSADYTMSRAGELDGEEMHGVAVCRGLNRKKVVFWIPARDRTDADDEVATAYIEDREDVDATVIVPYSGSVPNNGPAFRDFKVGGYCKFQVDLGAPAEKRRKQSQPSTEGEVDEITPAFYAMDVSND